MDFYFSLYGFNLSRDASTHQAAFNNVQLPRTRRDESGQGLIRRPGAEKRVGRLCPGTERRRMEERNSERTEAYEVGATGVVEADGLGKIAPLPADNYRQC